MMVDLVTSETRNASDSNGCRVMSISDAGQDASQLCVLRMKSSTSLSFKGHIAPGKCFNAQKPDQASICHRAAINSAVVLVSHTPKAAVCSGQGGCP